LGDVNGDNNCNSTDALIILSYDVGLPIPPAFLARILNCYGDVNSNGLTNSTDALIIMSFDVGIGVPFPVCSLFGGCPKETVEKEPTKTNETQIKVTANPTASEISRGMVIEVPVNIDISELDVKLGSFTSKLEWDNTALEFESYEGGTTNGFGNPVVNSEETSKGKLGFTSAVPEGAGGVVNVLNIKFKVTGEPGVSSALKLSFTAMASANTFEDLLPYLDSKEMSSSSIIIGGNPANYSLDNYPNPFNPTTMIEYSLPEAGPVKIIIYNTLGEQVRVLVNEEQMAGKYSVEWNSRNDHQGVLPTGVYILRMQTEGFVKDKKLLLLK